MLLERTEVPEERSVALLERLVVLPEVLRLVRAFWSALPAERAVLEPVLRLVVAALFPVERLVVAELEELRLVRSFWVAVPAERLVVEPVLRLVVAEDVLPEERLVVLLPVERLVLPLCELRLVRSFCT